MGDPPPQFILRVTTLALQKDSNIKITIPRESGDSWEQGWVPEKTKWYRYIEYEGTVQDNIAPDSFIRYLVRGNKFVGWLVYIQEKWLFTDKENIVMLLKSLGMSAKDIPQLLGTCVLNPWQDESIPFGEEYLGDRRWNRDRLELVPVEPIIGKHPTWDLILSHVGEGLDLPLKGESWATENKVKTGRDYLLLWIASMIRHPFEPLPYLFLYGGQNTGKSILHEAISLLFKDPDNGVIRGGEALLSSGRFNAELRGKVLCILEEVNLSQKKSSSYNRIKDWVTSRRMMIHPKGETPFMYPNTTHWIHCANPIRFCPVFPGDTRLIFLKVNRLEKEIPKPKLLKMLKAELPQILYTLLNIYIPESNSRLFIPVVDTFEKIEFAEQQRSIGDIWWNTQTFEANGYYITIRDAYEEFKKVIGTNLKFWPKSRFFQSIPDTFLVGRVENNKYVAVANRALKPQTQQYDPLFKRDGKLINREEAINLDKREILRGNLKKQDI